MFGLMGFNYIPLLDAYFSAFSFCLIYCVLGLISVSWKVTVPLMESVPLAGIGPGLCDGFLVGRTCACILVDGAGSCFSGGQCCVQ